MHVKYLLVAVLINVCHSPQVKGIFEEEIRKIEGSIKTNLRTLPEIGKSEQTKVVTDALMKMLLMAMPRSVRMDDMEAESDTMYVCAVNGHLWKVGSLINGLGGKKVTEDVDGSTKLDIPYNIYGGIYIKYKNYVQHFIMGIQDIQGESKVGFINVDVNLFVTFLPSSKVVETLNADQCVVTVDSIKVSLSSPYCSLSTSGHTVPNLKKNTVERLFVEYLNANVKIVEEKVRNSFYIGLARAGSWICLGNSDPKRIESESNKPPMRPNSDYFEEYCGKLSNDCVIPC